MARSKHCKCGKVRGRNKCRKPRHGKCPKRPRRRGRRR